MLIRFLTLVLLWLGAFLTLSPLIIVFITSITPKIGLISGFQWPKSFTFANYSLAWEMGKFWWAFFNSTLVAILVTLLQIITSATAGYALARLKFKGKQIILLIIISTLVIPLQILVIPIFLILKWGHLLNTYGALILPSAANGFGIFLLRQFFLTIPPELEEAAILDGASYWQVLWKIILPLSRPALVTLSMFTFIGEWNDLFKPLIFTTKPELRTVQLALADFQEQFTNSWSLLMAAVIIATIPILTIFLIGQKQFIQGIANTGIKK